MKQMFVSKYYLKKMFHYLKESQYLYKIINFEHEEEVVKRE